MPNEPIRQELLTWQDVDKLIDVLLGQLRQAPTFNAVLVITRGGIIPGGLLCEALNIKHVVTAAVQFPSSPPAGQPMAAWPDFLQFPNDNLLKGRHVLIVDDVWGSGRTISAVKGRVNAATNQYATCVFHYNPYRSLFNKDKPDFYGAITDAWIVYPWEIDRGLDTIPSSDTAGMN